MALLLVAPGFLVMSSAVGGDGGVSVLSLVSVQLFNTFLLCDTVDILKFCKNSNLVL